MRLGQHPIHPAIVHFPISCWVLVSFCDATYFWLGDTTWLNKGQWLLGIGLISAAIAMLFGLADIIREKRLNKSVPTKLLNKHITWVSSAWCIYLISWVCRQRIGDSADLWFTAAACSALAGYALLMIGAWHGAELVYQHSFGIKRADIDKA